MNIETGVAIWNAAVEACSTVAENCEPDDHGYLNIQEIAETIRMKCSVFTDGASKMTERMVPVELLERILSITQPIAPAISTEIRAIIAGPATAQPSAVACPAEYITGGYKQLGDFRPLSMACPTDKEK